MKLSPFIKKELTWIISGTRTKQEVLAELSRRCASEITELDEPSILAAFLEREKLNSTAEPGGIAFPHAMINGCNNVHLAVARLEEAADYGARDNSASDLFFVLIGGKDSGWEQIRLLARLGRLSHSQSFLKKLRAASDSQQLFSVMQEEDKLHV